MSTSWRTARAPSPGSPERHMAWLKRGLFLAGLMLAGCTVQTPLDPAQADEKIAAALDWLKLNSEYRDPAPLRAWMQQSTEQMKSRGAALASANDRDPY